ncbi:MAG: FAD-dependent oxidoreductase, partial [Acidobacteriota bacterium]
MKNKKLWLIVLLAVAGGILLRYLPVGEWLAQLQSSIKSLGAFAPIGYVLLYVATTLLLIPGSVLTIGAAGVFSFWKALAVVVIGANLGALGAFWLTRTFLRERVALWAAANPKFAALDRAIGREGFKMVLLVRLSPVFPFTLLNYLLGLTTVRTSSYVLANLIGMLPGTFLYVYIGATARDALSAGGLGMWQIALRVIGLLATVAVVVIVTRIARKALTQIESVPRTPASGSSPNDLVGHMTLADDPHDRVMIENCHPPNHVNPVPNGKYNLVAIGAGAAGLISAGGAGGLGAKAAIIERALMGGDCLVTGCVPSKAIIRAARAVYDLRLAKEFGVQLSSEPQIDFAAVMERMRRLRAEISYNDSAEKIGGKYNVDVFIGEARFISPTEIEVDGQRLKFDRAVIATGGRPAELPIRGLKEASYFTNENIFTITELPRRMVVIGGGPIGCELAQAFQRFGSAVTVLNDVEHILPREDRDAAELVHRQLVSEGVRIENQVKIIRVELRGKEKVVVYEQGGQQAEKPHDAVCDLILSAAGRVPNVEELNLEVAGVEYSREGVKVDDFLRTSNPKIYAAGDVCSRFKFTHAADATARAMLRNAFFFGRARVSQLVMPWVT